MVTIKKIKSYALISVYDKKNIKFLCQTLKKNKVEIISTGSTSKKIKSLGFNSIEISKLTNFNEVLDGRVKTLHPDIYVSILHDRDNIRHRNTFKKTKFPKIDYVIVNLYPFSKIAIKKKKVEEIVEMIDIGGTTLLRAAAKNYKNITTISSPGDYKLLGNNLKKNIGLTDLNFRTKMAQKTFDTTFKYDENISKWFSKKNIINSINLRYGENPNQKAVFVKSSKKSIFDYQIQGKSISYNNILDIESGLDFINEFKEPTTVIIKHNNACGVASSNKIEESFLKAFKSDKKSAFGGVILVNRKINEKLAKIISNSFFEILVAPSFNNESLNIFKKRKKMILINSNKIPKILKVQKRSVRFGKIIQKNNNLQISKHKFKIVTLQNKISEREYQDVLFAFKIVKHIKSNAIVLVKNKQTIGIGAGQMNRYDATKIAIMKYKENFTTKNYVCASDAFFPFVDSLQILKKNNCSCIAQPAGSVNDNKIINFANKNKLKLLFSNNRVFKH